MDAKGRCEGVAAVTATGTQLKFKVTEKINQGTLPIHSTFLFQPTFIASEHDVMVPSVEDIDSVVVEVATSPSQRHLQSDLVQGFFAPDDTLQQYVRDKLGVNALPYVGQKSTSLELSGGDEFVRRLAARGGQVERGLYACSLVELGERMAKAKVFASNLQATKEDLLRGMVKDVVHFVIPSAGEAPDYADYLKDQMSQAEVRGYSLRVVVGVLVDECATVTSVYNTEDCVYFKTADYVLLIFWMVIIYSLSLIPILMTWSQQLLVLRARSFYWLS